MDLYELLKSEAIEYQRFDHPAVFTCEEASRLIPDLPGAKTKNLFVRDRKGRNHFLIVVSDEKSVDLSALSEKLEISKLSFASPERLKKFLDLEPGSVSLLGIINDQEQHVQVIIDSNVWSQDALQCHPLVNTSTLVIERSDIEKLMKRTGHTFQIIDIPEREMKGA